MQRKHVEGKSFTALNVHSKIFFTIIQTVYYLRKNSYKDKKHKDIILLTFVLH